MRKHSIEQTAAWAKSWNVKGFEHFYPENIEKRRQEAVSATNRNNRDKRNERFRSSAG